MKWHGKGLDQGSLEHGKEICSSFKSNEVIKIKSNRKSRSKSEKSSKKRKFRNPGCHRPTPLRKNLVLEIWLLREPSQTYHPSETCCFSGFLFNRILFLG